MAAVPALHQHKSPSRSPALTKYLASYAESEIRNIVRLDTFRASYCLVIPCFDERNEFFERLIRQPLWRQDLLVVVVVNQPENSAVCANNQALLEYFQRFDLLASHDNLSLYRHEHSCFLIVSRHEPGRQIPVSQGVGLARKIGFDIAVQLYSDGYLDTPWIYSCDADAQLPDNYLSGRLEKAGAVVFDFQHGGTAADLRLQPEVVKATQLYEQAILYYQRCLQWAGSAYAFTSLGSALAVHAETYCQVRGFPRRSGGEDFYLLNKIAKIAPVSRDPSITIALTARLSDRVPFGTGPAVGRILSLSDPQQEFCYYHPNCFQTLKLFLQIADNAWSDISEGAAKWPELPAKIAFALSALGSEQFFQHLRKQVRTEAQYRHAFRQWFDAFNTLKFIKAMQELYPALPLKECLQNAPYERQVPSASAQDHYVARTT